MTSKLPARYGFIRTGFGNTIQFKLSADTAPYVHKVEGSYEMTSDGELGKRRWITGDRFVFGQWVAGDDFIPVIAQNFRRLAKEFWNSEARIKRYPD